MWRRTSLAMVVVLACAMTACTDGGGSASSARTTATGPAATATGAPVQATPATPDTTAPTPTAPTPTVTPTGAPTDPPTTVAPEPHRVFPVQDAKHSYFGTTHHDYPAADIFSAHGCGSPIVSPVDGVVLEVNRVNNWIAKVDDPATRGGKFLAIKGADGVRYYMAHFSELEAFLAPGVAVTAGQVVGKMGRTGRAGACHLHFALSPICPNPDWWVRRGVIWPQAYIRDWRNGVNTSPVPEIQKFSAANPNICSTPAKN